MGEKNKQPTYEQKKVKDLFRFRKEASGYLYTVQWSVLESNEKMLIICEE